MEKGHSSPVRVPLSEAEITCSLWQQEITENAAQREASRRANRRRSCTKTDRPRQLTQLLPSTARSYRFSTSPRKERALPYSLSRNSRLKPEVASLREMDGGRINAIIPRKIVDGQLRSNE